MAQLVKLKRSATPSAIPTTGQLDLGELAINTNDGKLYLKKDDGAQSIVEIGPFDIAVQSVASLLDVNFNSVVLDASNGQDKILSWDQSLLAFVPVDPAGVTEVNDLTASVTWDNVPDANVTQSSVTQHQAALSITESQISDLQSYLLNLTSESIDDLSDVNFAGVTLDGANGQGRLLSWDETLQAFIPVILPEVNDLTAAVTWANVPDANITQSSVTQHQTALSITESQISDLQSYLLNLTSESIDNLSDVDFNSVVLDGANGQDKILSWDETLQAFVPTDQINNVSAGTTDGALLRWESTGPNWEETTSIIISDSGNVGINQAVPDTALYVVPTSGDIAARFDSAETNTFITFSATGTTDLNRNRIGTTGDDLYFWANGVESLRLKSTGAIEASGEFSAVDTVRSINTGGTRSSVLTTGTTFTEFGHVLDTTSAMDTGFQFYQSTARIYINEIWEYTFDPNEWTPAAGRTITMGSAALPWSAVYGTTLYEGGTALSSIYASQATTLAGYGITDAYTQAQVDALTWDFGTDITGKPTTLSGYGITDAYTQAQVNALTWDFDTDITGKPTTLAGYGITDGLLDTTDTLVGNLTIDSAGADVVLGGSGSIAATTWANGEFHLGNGTNGWAMDSNEFYNSGAAVIGSIGNTMTYNATSHTFSGGDVIIGQGLSVTGTTDVADINATGSVTAGSATNEVRMGTDGIYFEDDKHAITFNDGFGNFNIRVANNGITDENFTENGYAAHWLFTQNSGTWQLQTSSASGTTGNATTFWNCLQWTPTIIQFYSSNSEKMRVDSAGVDITGALTATSTITATTDMTVSSDIYLKSNIEKIENPLDKIEHITGYTFNKKGEERRYTGVIAQDVEEVLPEAVTRGEDGYLSVSYGSLIGLMAEGIKAVRKEYKSEIDALCKEIEELKNGCNR